MKPLRRIAEAVWGIGIIAALICAIFALVSASCAENLAGRTALDVASCAGAGIASAAGPILGQVAGIVLGSEDQQAAEKAMEGIAISSGAQVALCALDRLIADLGGPPPKGAEPGPAGRAASRAVSLRAHVAGLPR